MGEKERAKRVWGEFSIVYLIEMRNACGVRNHAGYFRGRTLVTSMRRNASLSDVQIARWTFIGRVTEETKQEFPNDYRIYMYSVFVCTLTVDFSFGALPFLGDFRIRELRRQTPRSTFRFMRPDIPNDANRLHCGVYIFDLITRYITGMRKWILRCGCWRPASFADYPNGGMFPKYQFSAFVKNISPDV